MWYLIPSDAKYASLQTHSWALTQLNNNRLAVQKLCKYNWILWFRSQGFIQFCSVVIETSSYWMKKTILSSLKFNHDLWIWPAYNAVCEVFHAVREKFYVIINADKSAMRPKIVWPKPDHSYQCLKKIPIDFFSFCQSTSISFPKYSCFLWLISSLAFKLIHIH